MIHLSDLSWEDNGENEIKKYNVGDNVKFKILEIDVNKERVSLGIKQLSANKGNSDKFINKIVTSIIEKIEIENQLNLLFIYLPILIYLGPNHLLH